VGITHTGTPPATVPSLLHPAHLLTVAFANASTATIKKKKKGQDRVFTEFWIIIVFPVLSPSLKV
jgi:hypothetical protein